MNKEPLSVPVGDQVATVEAMVQQLAALPPFTPPFPISAPGLLLDPDPGYPAILVSSNGVVEGSYADPSVSINGDATIAVVSPVSEPSSWVLFVTGLLGLVGYEWRRRNRGSDSARI